MDENDAFFKSIVDMKPYKRVRPWIWSLIIFLQVVRIIILVASYWCIELTQFQFTCQVALLMLE